MQLHVRNTHGTHGGARNSIWAFSRTFESLLESAPSRVTLTETRCWHVGRAKGALCQICAIRDAEGRPIAESGLRRCEREVYRWPMRACLVRLNSNRHHVPPGYPRLGMTLEAIAAAGGDLRSAARFLGRVPINSEGRPIAESGLRRQGAEQPSRLAYPGNDREKAVWVPPTGRLAYPVMDDWEKAEPHLLLALRRVEEIWSKYDPQLAA